MRRKLLAVLMIGGLVLGGALFFMGDSPAQTGKDTAARAANGLSQIPISEVVLFSSGVGYFQREGDVQGNSRIDLSFQIQDINDLLKSMVLQDLGGGHVSAVSYDSQEPVAETLRSFAINLTGNPTYGQILGQARGEKVETILQQSNNTQPTNITGVIVGVERKQQSVNKQPVTVEMLNLWCAEGMRSVKLSEVQRIRFLNPVIDTEIRKALEVLALAHDTQKKAVSINFSGEGKRSVRVGYVVENPIWKTSYRLVLGKEKPFLQGWAVVENVQDEDWNNVNMSLISGRPISFQMDLYQPLFVQRPVVEPELFKSLRPPTYSGAMAKRPMNMPPPAGFGGVPGQSRGRANRRLEEKSEAENAKDMALNLLKQSSPLKPNEGVSSAAVATELGDFFQYKIEQPVTLPRQKSAMLPIVNEEIEADKVSIYNQRVHAKFPLHGLKFRNTTDLHLMQGPITVFETGSYAGDARILDLQPKEERLISYAIDLGTEVEPVVHNRADRIITIKINRGVIHATHKVREGKTYNIKNRSQHDRVVIIEHPFRQQFTLLTPKKASERARDVYRFEVNVPAGEGAKQDVIEERNVLETVSINNSSDQRIRFFMQNTVTSQKVRDALSHVSKLKGALSATGRALSLANRQLQDITRDQTRLRLNLKEVPPTSKAYKRYIDKFDEQETEIEQLRETIKNLQKTQFQQQRSIDNYLAKLTVE